MFKQSLLISAMAMTLTACGTQMDLNGSAADTSSNPNQTPEQNLADSDNQNNAGNNQPTNLPNVPDSDSGANDPVNTNPVATQPETSQPAAPETSGPEMTNPVVSQPETSQPEVTNPVVSQPEVSEPEETAPVKPEPQTPDNETATPTPTETNASAFVNGTQYSTGDRVANNNSIYECKVGGWCSLGASAYVPGEGFGWQDAWRLVGEGESTTPENGTTEPANPTEPATPVQPEPDEPNPETPNQETPNPEAPAQPIDTGDMDMTGWPKALQEKNVPYQNNTDKVVASYFVEWGVYGRDFHVADIPAQNLTHILYGFIPICGPNASLTAGGPASALKQACADKKDYEVTIHDSYAALEKSYPGDKWDDPIKGNFGQLMRMKASNPHIKVLPSVGGWTLSDPFFDLDDAQNRATFVASVKNFLISYPLFDGVDIDWEFPGGGGASANLGQASDAQTYVKLMRDLRSMLDDLETDSGRDLELSSAIGTSPRFIQAVDYANAAPYMDYIFMMTYDYKGAWSSETGHQTNLYASNMTADDSLSINIAVNEMLKQNVDPAKLVVGVAKYGRGWSNVSGATANPFTGTGGGALNESGYWEAGIMDYKLIESRYLGGNAEGEGINGWQHLYDDTAEAAYLWNAAEKKLISFDSARSVKAKSEFVVQQNLGGVFSWEIDADNGSILNAMHEGLGHSQR